MICTHILIDGNNLAYRAVAGYGKDGDYVTSSGKPNSLVYGFMSMLGNLRSCTSGAIPLVVWDGGYDHRTALSERGVELGIIPSPYKANRGEPDPIKDSIHDQMPDLRYIMATTDIPQIRRSGYEADDVIASYAKKISESGGMSMGYTVDRDYFQIISDSTMILRRDDMIGKLQFIEKYGIQPHQWVDVGALAGDTGDNIHGVPGIGEGTAIDLVLKHGDYESVIESCVSELSPLRAEYADIIDEDDLAELIDMKAHQKTNKYAGCYLGMPFTGVALAMERKEIKKIKVSTLMIAMYQQRIRLAYRLKLMVDSIDVPVPVAFDRYNENEFDAACRRFEVNGLLGMKKAFSCDDTRKKS
jgi:5'-3' exonuclease